MKYVSIRRMAGLLFIVMTVGLTGCGYSNESLHPSSVRTVYVEMFQTREFRRGIEFQLTEALRKEIDRGTPYRNAANNRADTIIEGEVLSFQETALGKDPVTNRPVENVGSLAVRYRWKDMRTGKLLVDRTLSVTTADYVKLLGEQSFDAYQLAVNQMARKIVNSMETAW